MLITTLLGHIMKERGYTQAELAKTLGISQAAMYNSLQRKTMKIDTAIKYLEPLGYEVAIVPVGSKLPSGSYALESSVPEITVDLDDPGLMLG